MVGYGEYVAKILICFGYTTPERIRPLPLLYREGKKKMNIYLEILLSGMPAIILGEIIFFIWYELWERRNK